MVSKTTKQEQGSVLVLVLILVSTMAFLAFEAMRNSRIDATASATLRSKLQSDAMIEAGLNLAKIMIKEDDANVDSYYEDWAKFDDECEKLNLFFNNAKIKGKITDENAKFPVNALANEHMYADSYYEYLVDIFELMALAYNIPFEPKDFADAVKHWVSPELPNNKLDTLYANKKPSYAAPRAPMKSINEFLLLEVPGISPENMQRLFEGTNELPGIVDLFTVYTSGPININTADKILLFAATSSEDVAKRVQLTDRLLRFRANPRNRLNYFWFENISQSMIDDVKFFNSKFSYRSNCFQVKINVETEGAADSEITAILKRGDFGATNVEYASF